jgi:hypothetical protein
MLSVISKLFRFWTTNCSKNKLAERQEHDLRYGRAVMRNCWYTVLSGTNAVTVVICVATRGARCASPVFYEVLEIQPLKMSSSSKILWTSTQQQTTNKRTATPQVYARYGDGFTVSPHRNVLLCCFGEVLCMSVSATTMSSDWDDWEKWVFDKWG